MAKLKAFIASVMCGFSTFTIMPSTNYTQHIPTDAGQVTKAAWQRTGINLRNAMSKVGEHVEQKECAN